MGRTRVTGKVEPIVKKWLSKDEAKSYIGCSDDFLRTLREKALVSFSQFGKMIWYDLSSIDVSTHCMALVYPISQLYLCTELKILFLWTLLIVF